MPHKKLFLVILSIILIACQSYTSPEKISEDIDYAPIMHSLAEMFQSTQDYEQAVKWYRQAADEGYVESQWNLGLMYYNGFGVNQSYEEAAKWFRLAAEQGNPIYQFVLGDMYYYGEGVPKDLQEALKWYERAAQGYDAADYMVSKIKKELNLKP